MYAIISKWSPDNRVSSYNYVETELEAKAIVGRVTDKLLGPAEETLMAVRLESEDCTDGERLHFQNYKNPLATNKLSPDSYYLEMPTIPVGSASFAHRARFWIADPANKSVSFDEAACHAWQSKVTGAQIDAEAERRINKIFSPDNPSQGKDAKLELLIRQVRLQNKGTPNWTVAEKAEWDADVVTHERTDAVRAAAQVFKDDLLTKTPEEIMAVDPADDTPWPE